MLALIFGKFTPPQKNNFFVSPAQIFVTELDFVASTTSSSPLPVENDSPVVQLSYVRLV